MVYFTFGRDCCTSMIGDQKNRIANMDLTDDQTTVTATESLEDEQEISFTCEYEYCPGSFSPLWYCNSCRCTYCE